VTGLLSVIEARERLISALTETNVVRVRLENALGRVIADPLTSPLDYPSFDNSSMDGFAVRSVDTLSASSDKPVGLNVLADIPAGSLPDFVLLPGQAARIMTGAPLPDGADSIVPIEDTDRYPQMDPDSAFNHVNIYRPTKPGNFVRNRGMDFLSGQLILPAGHRLMPQDVGILATLGISHPRVYRKPRVALLATGDELLSIEDPLTPGKIRDSNTYTLSGQIRQLGATVFPLGLTKDNQELIKAKLDTAVLKRTDLLVTSAGVSLGAFDFVRKVIEENGKIDFWRVNMRPGKPIAFGQYKGTPIIGLPGNPVSAFMCFEVFVYPAIRKIAGESNLNRRVVRVQLSEPIESDGRESYLRGVISLQGDGLIARLTGHQGSGNLFSLIQANALLIVPSGVKSLPAGSFVNAWLL
jgi:molybdopterin molybdotransferase